MDIEYVKAEVRTFGKLSGFRATTLEKIVKLAEVLFKEEGENIDTWTVTEFSDYVFDVVKTAGYNARAYQ